MGKWRKPEVTSTLSPMPTATYIPVTPLVPFLFTPQLLNYGIQIRGKGFNRENEQSILNATGMIGSLLKNYIPFSVHPAQAFHIAMGSTTIMLDPLVDTFGNCLTTKNFQSLPQNQKRGEPSEQYHITYNQNTGSDIKTVSILSNTPHLIVCKEPPTESALVHEFGHVFTNQQTALHGADIYTLVGPIYLGEGKYLDVDENNFWTRNEEGFLKGRKSWEHDSPNNSPDEWSSGYAKDETLDLDEGEETPARMKELVELFQAGYKYVKDEATNSYILIKP